MNKFLVTILLISSFTAFGSDKNSSKKGIIISIIIQIRFVFLMWFLLIRQLKNQWQDF